MTDFWRVNSYGYPNPFTTERAQKAWRLFEQFLSHTSYKNLKTSLAPGRTAHAVESWKANFEECGLLHVTPRGDTLQFTPAGRQLKVAADAGNQTEFAWIGTNLILRYRLIGITGRRPRPSPHDTSDVLPYWLVLAAALELGGLWEKELFRVLAGVFRVADAPAAIQKIRDARAGSFDILSLPNLATPGAAYNSLNQVAVKAGLSHLTLLKDSRPSPYEDGEDENFWAISPVFRPIVELALGGPPVTSSACSVASASWIDRMPKAPNYGDERLHFEAVGTAVPTLADAQLAATSPSGHAPTANLGADLVHLLTVGTHCVREAPLTIHGPTLTLCVLARGSRLVLDDDVSRTYIVEDKTLVSGSQVRVTVRPARPITNPNYVRSLFEGVNS